MEEDRLTIIQNGIDLEELEKKSRGWELIKKFIEKEIKRYFEKMLEDDINIEAFKGQIKFGRKILKYPKIQIEMALRKKKELDQQLKKE